MERKVQVRIPVQTDLHLWILTDLTDEELQLKLNEVKGDFQKIMHNFEISDSIFSEYESYDDRNDTEIIDDKGKQIAYYNPNEAC